MDRKYVEDLLAKAARVNENQRELMERIASEGRLPNEEEKIVLARMDAEYEELTTTADEYVLRLDRDADQAAARAIVDSVVKPEAQAQAQATQTCI